MYNTKCVIIKKPKNQSENGKNSIGSPPEITLKRNPILNSQIRTFVLA